MTYSPECVAAFEAKFGGAPEGCERTATGYAPNKYYAYPEAQMHNAKLEAFAANWERVKELEEAGKRLAESALDSDAAGAPEASLADLAAAFNELLEEGNE